MLKHHFEEAFFAKINLKTPSSPATVEEENPAPPGMYKTSQVME